MAVYDIDGVLLNSAYDINTSFLSIMYDIEGNVIDYQKDPYRPGRTLVYEDDFDGQDLDEIWTYEVGDWGRGAVGNKELQFYRRQNVSLENGMLVITAKREQHVNKNWTSGSITGNKTQYWLYGRIEAKIKYPNVSGAFGAFWLVGSNAWFELGDYDYYDTVPTYPPMGEGSVPWPQCGEIDIMETIPGNTSRPPANLWDCNGSGSLGSARPNFDIDMSKWHIYSMEWTPEYIAIFVDDVEFKRWTFSNYTEAQIAGYKLPQRVHFNLAVGSEGGSVPSSVSEMKMYVDWLRIYAPLAS